MSRLLPFLIAPLAIASTACVTINVYFPAAAAQQAADRVIDEVWGGRAMPAPATPPATAPAAEHPSSQLQPSYSLRLAQGALDFLLPTAQAQNEPDLQISSPEIARLTGSMEARFQQLRPYFESGAVGLGSDGFVVLRAPASVPIAERNQVRAWVANENADRASLYREIAMANGQPQWETDIRRVFATRWVERAPAGWYVQDANGGWRQK